MSVHTRSQKLAQAAFPRIQQRHSSLNEKQFKEYTSFAKKFPALIHTCGLAQAVAFAEAKGSSKDEKKAKAEMLYLEDLAAVLSKASHGEIESAGKLAVKSRSEQLSGYLRLSRDAINAAGWLKRYVEAAAPEDTTEAES